MTKDKQEEEQEQTKKGRMRGFLGNKWTRRAAIGAVAVATGFGTFSSRDGDFPPIYVNKTGTSGGIAAGLYVHIEEGAKFYGPILGLTTKVDGELYGANVNILDVASKGTVNGLEVGAFDIPSGTRKSGEKKMNGLDIGFLNFNHNLNGGSIGFFNISDHINGARAGLASHAHSGNYFGIGAEVFGDEEAEKNIAFPIFIRFGDSKKQTSEDEKISNSEELAKIKNYQRPER